MEYIDLGLAWNWEFDDFFIYGIERECTHAGLSTYRVEFHNIAETLRKIRAGKLRFSTFLDRASDEEEEFLPLARYLHRASLYLFNRYDRVEKAKDKATMHLELMAIGVLVPYTIIVTPFNTKKEIELSLTELSHLGRPFIIKPANTTGGGIGVVLGAESLKEILETRQHHKNDKYLLQETIYPKNYHGHKAWFRVFYAFGEILCCWWDPETHVYKEISPNESRKFGFSKLEEIAAKIHTACGLDFFSSEIAQQSDSRFIVVDYVNEICDMRPQSRHFDGVPDRLIHRIQQTLAQKIQDIVQ